MTDGGKQFPGQTGFPTPLTTPDEMGCRQFQIPSSTEWFSLFMGALEALRLPYLWFQTEGGMTPDEAATEAGAIIDAAYDNAEAGCASADVETPYWDDASDVDDNASTDDQLWYGEVTDATAPADELDFVENILVWSFAGLLAVAGAPAAAIAFTTIAPKFLIAQKAGDVGEVIRIVLDGHDVTTIDTTGHAGEIITTPVVGDPTLSTHQLYLVKVS